MSISKRSPAHTGIEVRHQTRCRTKAGGQRCNCQPSYRAVAYDARQGRKVQRTFRSYAEAKAWRSDAGRAIRDGRLRATRPQTLREAAEAFLDGIKAGTITSRQGAPYKPSTARSYAEAIRLRLLPAFGAHRLTDITRATCSSTWSASTARALAPAASTTQSTHCGRYTVARWTWGTLRFPPARGFAFRRSRVGASGSHPPRKPPS
jgi:hypothetical protein